MLAVADIQLSFAGLKALDGISLSVEDGELLGIIGPNGSGKSTLFNVISGLYAPDAGTVRFQGKTLTGRSPRAIAAMGLARTYQNKRLFGGLTVLENVMVPALRDQPGGLIGDVCALPGARAGWREAHAQAMGWLDFVGLGSQAHAEAASLAYGQQNRLELARALAGKPRLLLLDEPAAGLSQAERGEMRALIERIRFQGITVTLVEHDMRIVMELCTRIVALDQGRVIAAGLPEEIVRDKAVIAAYLGEPMNE